MAKLLLEDGREFIGSLIGAAKTSFGEIVFNTAMTGYQEVLTDPSYAGQILVFTYPEIGNYGCNDQDYESKICFAKALVIKNLSPCVSNFRAQESLEEFLLKHDITGICDLDTRALTKHLRDRGAMRAVISPDETDNDVLLKQIKAQPSMSGCDLVQEVTCKQPYLRGNKFPQGAKKVLAIDFGIKQNILNKLMEYGCQVEVVPANTKVEEILQKNPDGIFLSNGPGDPAAVSYAIDTVKTLVDKFSKPIFGICLGHQILALASGASTYKLKFGHRGANHPIKNLLTNKIEIASHNHGFAVDPQNLPDHIEVTHVNINDHTIAGIKLKNRPNVFSVQYHPEASPGPHDSDYLFQDFVSLI